MTYDRAQEIMRDEDNRLQSRSECIAEAGMGAVSMGFDGNDGALLESMRLSDIDAGPEGQAWAAEVRAAEAYLADAPQIIWVTEYEARRLAAPTTEIPF
jgi:hypothetical protein